MANTIESTTDEILLRSIIDGSITELEDDTITGKLPQYKLFSCIELEKVILPNITSAGQFLFAGCTNLKTVIIPKATAIGNNIFEGCTNLTTVDLSGVVSLKDGQGSLVDSGQCNNLFSGCTSLKTVKFDNLISVANASRYFRGNVETYVFPKLKKTEGSGWIPCEVTKKIDFGAVESFTSYSSDPFFGSYNSKPVTEAIIIRSNSVPTLSSTQSLHRFWANDSTASGQNNYNYTYRFYVPQALISEYQNATNWSNYSTFFLPIEGSIYDGYWADGTPITPYSTSGMVAYYDIDNINDWDSDTKTILNHVDNDYSELIAFNGVSRWTTGTMIEQSSVPTTFYDGYAKSSLSIDFVNSIANFSDTITLEFVYANNSDINFSFIGCSQYNANLESFLTGTCSGNFRKFSFVTITISDNEIKAYVNGELKQSKNISSTMLNRRFLRIWHNDGYLGHVSMWNRVLNVDEITEHYNHYVEVAHVGETAYDSNGNFIAT